MPDHVHMGIAIPPKHPVALVIAFLKGKSAIAVARLSGKERNFKGEHLGARLRRFHRRLRTGTRPPLHPRPRGSGWSSTILSTMHQDARFSATPKLTGQQHLRQSSSSNHPVHLPAPPVNHPLARLMEPTTAGIRSAARRSCRATTAHSEGSLGQTHRTWSSRQLLALCLGPPPRPNSPSA